MRKQQLFPPEQDRPKHCGKPMDPEPGDGIYECSNPRCDRWVHFPRGLSPMVKGRDLEKLDIAWNQLMS